jgi:Sodium/calcium exchanger protein
LLAGAEPEEMITAAIASARHHPGLAAGDAIGANLTMLTLVLGLAAMARPLPLTGRVRGYAAWSALAGGLAVLVIARGSIARWQGGLLLAAYRPGWRCCGGGNASRQLSGRRPRPAKKTVRAHPRWRDWRWRWARWL